MVRLDHIRIRHHRRHRHRGEYRATWRGKNARLVPTRTSRRNDWLQLSQAWGVSESGADCGEKKARGERSRRRAGGGVDIAAGTLHWHAIVEARTRMRVLT